AARSQNGRPPGLRPGGFFRRKPLMSHEAFHALAEEVVDTTLRLDPVTATLNGVHDYDGELGDPGLGAVRRRVEWYREKERRRAAEVDPEALSPAERIEFDYLRSRLRAGLLVWETQREAERCPFLYPDTCLYGAFLLYAREFAPLAERKEPLLRRLSRTRSYLAEARRAIQSCPRVFAEIALEVAEAGKVFVDEVRAGLASQLPEEKARIDAACDEASRGFKEYADWIRADLLSGPDPPFAIGREAFDARLQDEHLLPYDAESLEALGWKVMRETQAEMARVAETIAPGK